METLLVSGLPCGCHPAPPEVTLSNSRKMGTMMKRMMSRVWIMMMPSFSVFRRFNCAQVLNPKTRSSVPQPLSNCLSKHSI